MINQQIQHYRITSELGKGGMATVYLAHDLKFDTKVAIKILNKEFIHNDNIRKRFITEARNIYRMTHPNMVRVTDLIEEGDVVAFVMEYIDGETLKEYLESRGKLKDDELKDIFSQMLEALNYVHEQQLVHRDIKPSNFMLDKNGKIKLLDFGIAKTLDANALEYTQTTTGMQMGTPMYMSPEQIAETKSVTAQSDIYSLGVVLWQMAMGKKPYDSQTISNFQLQTKIVNEPLPLTNTIWDSSIQKATHKEPSHRYKSCNTWQREIENLLDGNNSQSDYTKIETHSASAYRNVKSSSNSEQAKNTTNLKKEKQERKGFFNLKIISAGLGILLIGIILIFILSRADSYHVNPTSADSSHPLAGGTPIPTPNANYVYHKVCAGEGMNSIATKYGVTVEKIMEWNDLKTREIYLGQRLRLLKGACGKKVVKTTPIVSSSELKIGQKHQGGIIFYLDSSGKHGKVCTEFALGSGTWYWAMKKCKNLNLNGFLDWYLPSIGELELIYNNKKLIKGLENSEWGYWSSTEYDANNVYACIFSNGSTNDYYPKTGGGEVLGIRTF